jgi:hypothetical protein
MFGSSLPLVFFEGGLMTCYCFVVCLHVVVSGTTWSIWVTWRVSYKRQRLLNLREHLLYCYGVRDVRFFQYSVLCCVRVCFLILLFCFCPVCKLLSVSLDCLFLIASYVYLCTLISCRSIYMNVIVIIA